MLDPDNNYKDHRLQEAEEALVRDLSRQSCEEFYAEPQYGMDPEYDTPDFGDLSPDDVAMLNRALNLTSKVMALDNDAAMRALDIAHEAVDAEARAAGFLDDLPF